MTKGWPNIVTITVTSAEDAVHLYFDPLQRIRLWISHLAQGISAPPSSTSIKRMESAVVEAENGDLAIDFFGSQELIRPLHSPVWHHLMHLPTEVADFGELVIEDITPIRLFRRVSKPLAQH
jgi:hypothetical protein